MKAYIGLMMILLTLGACSNSTDESVVEVGAGADDTERERSIEGEDAGTEEDTAEESEPSVEEDDRMEDVAAEENAASVMAYSDFDSSDVRAISDIKPNALAKKFEGNSYDFTVEDGGSEDYRQAFDLDGDGSEETIEIGYEFNSDSEERQYIIMISDHNGNPKYAEYLYNHMNAGQAQRILTVVDLDEDGHLDIVLTNMFSHTASMLNGYQSLGRSVFSFNETLGQFTRMPVIGSYYKNTLENENLTVHVDETITGFSDTYSYIDDFSFESEESELDVLHSLGIVDEDGDFSIYTEDYVNGQAAYVMAAYASKMNGDDTFELVSNDFVYYARAGSIDRTSAYNWNAVYGWMEPVGAVLDYTDNSFDLDRNLFDANTFNSEFGTDEVIFEDYLGQWQAVIDGRRINKHIHITEESIAEIESFGEEEIEIEVEVQNYLNKEETNQLMAVGEISSHTEYDETNDYDNLFTLMNVEDQWLLMDKFGYFYVKE